MLRYFSFKLSCLTKTNVGIKLQFKFKQESLSKLIKFSFLNTYDDVQLKVI